MTDISRSGTRGDGRMKDLKLNGGQKVESQTKNTDVRIKLNQI